MSHKTIGFIGSGRVTGIFLEGWKRANASPATILVSDCKADAFAKLKSQFPNVQTTTDSRPAAAQDIVFLAVHPPVMAEVMDLIPVKPLAEMESRVSELYRTRLPALFQKIKPQA